MKMQIGVNGVTAVALSMVLGVAQAELSTIPVESLDSGSTPAAVETPSRFALGIRAGTSGLGAELSMRLSPRFDVRAGYYGGSYSDEVNYDGIDYDGELSIGAGSLMLDFRPFAGAFRVSAGAFTTTPDIDFSHVANDETLQIGNAEYTADGRLDGSVDLGDVAPYAGIGWGGGSSDSGLGFSLDIGVVFAESPAIALQATGRACNSTVAGCDPDGFTGFDVNDPDDARAQVFRDELEQERQNAESDVADYDLYPVVSLGLHYRF